MSVGEVRVRARLANAVDEVLVRRGTLAPDQIRTVEVDAVVDTGASRSVVPATVASDLGLDVRGELSVRYADGRAETVGVTGPLVFELEGRDTLDEALVFGSEVLIGQTVLEKLDLLVDCDGRRVIPNPAHPDGPMFRI